jgi:hypothetical protein
MLAMPHTASWWTIIFADSSLTDWQYATLPGQKG